MPHDQGLPNCVSVHEVTYDQSSDRTLAEILVEALAEVEGVDPTEIDPLYDSVNLELLERLVYPEMSSPLSSGIVGFSAQGWTVFVHADGRINICDPVDGADPSSMVATAVD